MKQFLYRNVIPFLCASLLVFGCGKDTNKEQDESISLKTQMPDDSIQQKTEVFTLRATCGAQDTKVQFGDDGLSLLWSPNDHLYLIDVEGKKKTVIMTADITQASKSANFRSTSSVLSGNYIVISGTDHLNITLSNTLLPDLIFGNKIVLYGTLTVEDGQTSASISLSHAFAKLKFTYTNYPSDLSSVSYGMAVSEGGIPRKGAISSTGFSASDDTWYPNLPFEWYNTGNTMSILVAPCDYTGKTVIFYCYGTSSDGRHITYEIQKQGIDLKAGVNYNIEFDFSKASVSTITQNILRTAADFRAAAYWDDTLNKYTVDSDIDFANEVFIPIEHCESINGNNHVLSNISISYPKCDYIGLVRMGVVSNVGIKNVTVTGRDNVGAIVGCLSNDNTTSDVSKVIVNGTSSVSGRYHVGGLYGSLYGRFNISESAFEGIVNGDRYVGGIIGDTGNDYNGTIASVYSRSEVTGNDYVGGISGNNSRCPIKNSYHIGKVSGVGSYVGGIDGTGRGGVSYCYSNSMVSSMNGISYIQPGIGCITSCDRLSSNGTQNSDYCNFSSTKTFISGLSIINVEEAYSTQVWPDIAEQCPLLQWQSDALNGDIIIPGYGDVNW